MACETVWKSIVRHEDAWLFLKPVKPDECPDYADIIRTPMDFGAIKNKLDVMTYTEAQEFVDDARLIFKNCAIVCPSIFMLDTRQCRCSTMQRAQRLTSAAPVSARHLRSFSRRTCPRRTSSSISVTVLEHFNCPTKTFLLGLCVHRCPHTTATVYGMK